jgi:5'-methylthioadenosine phosphorylase
VDTGSGVSQAEVFAQFARNIDRLKGLLTTVIGQLPDPDGCTCSTWAEGIDLTYEVPGD